MDRHRELWSAIAVISLIIGIGSAILTGFFYQHEMSAQSMIAGVTSVMATCVVAVAYIQGSNAPDREEPEESNG